MLAQQKEERAARMREQDRSERRHAAAVVERMRGMEAARQAQAGAQ